MEDGTDPAGKTILLCHRRRFRRRHQLHPPRPFRHLTRRHTGSWNASPNSSAFSKTSPTSNKSSLAASRFPKESTITFHFHGPRESWKIRLNTIPNKVPYLKAPPDLVKTWAHALAGRNQNLRRPQLAPAANPARGDLRSRSIDIFKPLAAVEEASNSSASKKAPTPTVIPTPRNADFANLTADITRFHRSRRLHPESRLSSSASTPPSSISLAPWPNPSGSSFPRQPDFRWMFDREAIPPGSPTMRLFRQPHGTEDWDVPIAKMVAGSLKAIRQMTEAESHNQTAASPARVTDYPDGSTRRLRHRLISLAPDNNTDAHNNRGNALRRLSRSCHDEAAAAYRRAIQINPNQAAPHANLGQHLFRSQQKPRQRSDPLNIAAAL